MKPICVPCQRFYRCKKNNFPFIEAMPVGDSDLALPGAATPDCWKPYKLWFGDLWECPDCGATIVAGVAQRPLSEHYQPEFARAVATHAPTLQVNDC